MTKLTDPEELNPGIRRTVAWLQQQGFDTCDSGDGETHDFDCDHPTAYVALVVDPTRLAFESDRLADLISNLGIPVLPMAPTLEEDDPATVTIQASYCPAEKMALIYIARIHDRLLPPEAGI